MANATHSDDMDITRAHRRDDANAALIIALLAVFAIVVLTVIYLQNSKTSTAENTAQAPAATTSTMENNPAPAENNTSPNASPSTTAPAAAQ